MSEWSDRRAARAPRPKEPPTEPTGESSTWRPPRRRGSAWVPLVILVIGLVLLLYSMQFGSVTTSGYDLQRLQAEQKEWQQRNEQLQLELAKVQSLAWIEIEAVQRLGMQKASRVTYLEVTLPEPAEPEAEPTPSPAVSRNDFSGVLGFWRALLVQIGPEREGR